MDNSALKRLTAVQFKDALKPVDPESPGAGLVYPHAAIVKSCWGTPEKIADPADVDMIKAAGADPNLVRTWKISSEAVDRDGDTISLRGWKLENYRKGGSVLWGHGNEAQGTVPIARPLKVWRNDGYLKSIAEFTPRDMNPFGYMVFQMADRGFVRGASVGFKPIEFEQAEDRDGFMPLNFSKQELLEWSVTPIPSNPEALEDAKSLGIDLIPLKDWIDQVMAKEVTAYGVPEADLLTAYRCVAPRKTYSISTQPEGVTTPSPQPNQEENVMSLLSEHKKAAQAFVDKAVGVVQEQTDSLAQSISDLSEYKAASGDVLSEEARSALTDLHKSIGDYLEIQPAPAVEEIEGDPLQRELSEKEVEVLLPQLKALAKEMASEQFEKLMADALGRAD